MSMPPGGGRAARGGAAALTVGLAALITVTACTSSGSPASAPPGSAGSTPSSAATDTGPIVPADGTLRWHACAGLAAEYGIHDCTMLSVPLNYADPGGRHISLALDMVPATAPPSQQQGILLVNPGGPGATGLPWPSVLAHGLSPSVGRDYDIVGFDPRGVGSSVPALSCDPGFFSGPRPNYIPASAAAEDVNINRAKTYADDCEQKFGWLLPYMTTGDMARDLDSIRAAFGVAKINYFGFSWGTYLGQVYATLFPSRLRRMVLDSTVDPTGAWYTDNVDQDYAFQGRLDAFYAWVARYDSTYHLGSTAAQVQAAYDKARNQLLGAPADGILGPDELDDTFEYGGYTDTIWPGLAQALSSYLNDGQVRVLVAQYRAYGVQNENEFAVYNAVECSDVSWPRSFAYWTSDTEMVYKTAPFYAWGNAWFNAACAFWPVPGPAEPLQINGTGLPGILMLQGTLDAATPYAGAQDAHRLLPSARMVVVEGGGNHGQSFEQPPDACVQGYANAYLASGALPQGSGLVNATCPAVPDPTPGS
ncbi:MAG TPA: alpha/beta hydrolase [Streptosporangiaceae bacterium]|nr:alpha/beta hydrolase [Streptosporangiaceae bacterium]HLN68974.1 alpha/beta hydrolase [Streptosporangiaceae bacterium]